MCNDAELLARYAQNGSESAFTELVQRQINLVYSTALREAHGDAFLAEDITQAVFINLAQKAAKLKSHPALAGWLYTSVRQTAANLRRASERRHRREDAAMSELIPAASGEPGWEQVRPVIDDAMHELNDVDRAAVVLRFFQDRSLKEVGQALGVNENAARMRVDRALEKLRSLLAKRGVTSTAAGLAALLAASVANAAPAGLAVTVAASAVTGAGAASSTALTLLKVLTMTKLQASAIGFCIVAAVALPAWQQTRIQQLTRQNSELQEQSASLPALRQQVQRLQQASAEPAEVERLRASETRLLAEVNRLRGQAGNARRATAETAQLRNALNQRDHQSTNSPMLSGAMSMAQGMLEQQLQGRLARMKAKLNLTPEQEQSIHDLLMKQAEASSQAAQNMLLGKGSMKDFMRDAAKSGMNQEDQIKALLTPEQLAAYPDLQKEETAANARSTANAELLQLQGSIGLTDDQLDKVFPVLYEQTLKQLNGKMEGLNPAQAAANPMQVAQQMFEQKAKALEGILTPTQMEGYRQFQASQLKMVQAMWDGSAGATPGK